jgi:glucose/arabinose dehydrogenase
MRKGLILLIGIVLVLLIVGVWWRAQSEPNVPAALDESQSGIEIVASDLEIPWELVFLPDASLLVTERPGRLLKIDQDKTVIPVSGVQHVGEGGLLGLTLHPDFARNQLLYLYLTSTAGGGLSNRVERYRLNDTTLQDRTVIIDNIPGAAIHDGGRIAFGPDRLLYITTGDAGVENNAQNTASLAGKILRLRDDGSIPTDNPFGNAVYSYGHRNIQGIAWDSADRLWATEHGRSGIRSGFDEVNLIEKGANYGWPVIEGDAAQANMRSPVSHSGSTTTWAPAGATIHDDSLLFTGLRGQALYQMSLDTNEIMEHFTNQFGRLRTVMIGPDGKLYLLTNNRDGRGNPQANDDKIIRIDPMLLQEQ